jgi:hypothetical protein
MLSSLQVDPALLERARREATRRGISVSALIAEGLELAIAAAAAPAAPAARPRLGISGQRRRFLDVE